MAGSYLHIVDAKNRFRENRMLIDNLGDAYEALEECYDMIQFLSGGDKRRIWEAHVEGHIKKRCLRAFNSVKPGSDIYSYERYWESDDEPAAPAAEEEAK